MRDGADHDDLDQEVDDCDDREPGEEGEADVAFGVPHLARGQERGLESAEREHEDQHRLRPVRRRHGLAGDGRRVEMRESQDDEQGKRQELRAGEDVDRPGGASYPDHVHDCNGAGEGCHHDRARSAARDLGPELGEVEHEEVEVRGGTQEARPHEQPADLESDQRAVGRARIEIDAAMFAESARDLREAE